MKLQRISIHGPDTWEKWTGYRGEITFEGSLGKVQIQIGEELSRNILSVCADAIVAASQQVARELTANVIEQVQAPAIEAPAE